MITKFHIYESDNYVVDKILSNKLKDKFFFPKFFTSEYVVLVEKILIKKSGRYWPYGDCFDVTKSGEIKEPSVYGLDYTLEEFEKIKFYTAQEFWNERPKLCEDLYLKVIEELKAKKYGEWYGEMLINYRNILRTIPQLEYVELSDRYNL
jgi:hypothetical protein